MSSNALTFDDESTSKDDEDDDSDAEPFEASWKNIDWRMSPGESYSDWTIQVVAIGKDHPGTTEYHVHQYFLTVGTRKSGYFEALCRANADFAENKNKTSRVELHELAANAFPAMLDYIYNINVGVELTTENATPMHFLGRYFDIPRLRWLAKQFIKKDVCLSNCHLYYVHSCAFSTSAVMRVVQHCCTSQMSLLVQNEYAILECKSDDFWAKVLRGGSDLLARSQLAAKIIPRLLDNGALDSEKFNRLTCEETLCEIDPKSAFALLECEAMIYDHNGMDCLTSLQERCLAALTTAFVEIEATHFKSLSRQGPLFLVEFLTRTQALLSLKHHQVIDLEITLSDEKKRSGYLRAHMYATEENFKKRLRRA
ncbi:hypothetical protein MPSEU_000617400 [Mayamaea pseudoterrestris]|nr:hypothetical protein MPSEU_000617400 [Mayamaea pseudoterrestris]